MTRLFGFLVILLVLLGNDAKNLLSLTEGPLKSTNTHSSHINTVQFRTHFAALPRDLRVVAVLLNGTRDIGLNVTWQPGNTRIVSPGFAPTSSYTLLILPMNKSEEGTKYCGNLSYHQDVDPDTLSWLVTFDLHHEDSHLQVHPECTYKIRLWANPRERDVTAELHYDFTVPRCVKGVAYEEVCSCRLSESTLPLVHIESLTSIDSGRYQVTWSVMKPEFDLSEAKFLVITGPMYLRAFDEQASVYALETVAVVPYSDELTSYVITFNTSVDEAEHVLIVQVKDKYHCLGPATNRTFLASFIRNKKLQFQQNHALVMGVVVPSVAVLLVLALGVLVLALAPRGNVCRSWLRRKTRHGTLQTVKSWRPSYRIVNRHAETGGNDRYISNRLSAEERNVLYIEQEIQEALERGDVDRYEVSYDRIHLGKQIGRGAFGRVFLARIDSVNGTPIDKMIAVKKLKHRASPDELDDFLTEISTFKRVGHHPNVVSLVGCCTLTLPYCMLMEWVPCGDLLRYLRRLRAQLNKQRAQVAAAAAVPPPRPSRNTTADNPYIDVLPEFALPSCVECSYVTPETPRADLLRRGSSHSESSSQMQVDGPSSLGNSSSSGQARRSPPSRQNSSTLETPLPAVELDARELHSFALQIARGMAHLERQQITHRDLAARNVLIDQNRTLKISDFGLSRRGIYVNTKRRKVPLRWLSIEAMRDHLYSSRSDVWAFGVVLWEIGTLGGFPYPTVSDGDLLNFLLHGKRLEKPHNCTNELYELMMRCWSFEAEDRPTFGETCSLLEASLEHRQVYVDFANLVSAASDELPLVQQSS